eukprot:CAMPEP_0113858786 /NCGR_PEP_ID=MMETSP0372-20130328/11590_1 /TAXON_ID=340204 /ORGANISM="Lankesteria abbotti" /LENGTH=139 /DNA_ID=CAMNT_0000836147 /DNA_START=6 /DNA_END=422 /DNA_ORIENTATION=+ /assembly_acc=CAM_ASM_000359
MTCPEDESYYSVYDSAAGRFISDGCWIYSFLIPVDGVCLPSYAGLSLSTDTKLVALSLSDCARQLDSAYPDATAFSFIGGTCYVSTDTAVTLDTTNTTDLSCLKRCNVLPGGAAVVGGSPTLTAESTGDGSDMLTCAAA